MSGRLPVTRVGPETCNGKVEGFPFFTFISEVVISRIRSVETFDMTPRDLHPACQLLDAGSGPFEIWCKIKFRDRVSVLLLRGSKVC